MMTDFHLSGVPPQVAGGEVSALGGQVWSAFRSIAAEAEEPPPLAIAEFIDTARLTDLPEEEKLLAEKDQRVELLGLVARRYELGHFFAPLLDYASSKLSGLEEGAVLKRAIEENLAEERADAENPSEYATLPHSEGRKALMVAMMDVCAKEHGAEEEYDAADEYDAWLKGLGSDLNNLENVSVASRQLIKYYRGLIDRDPLAGAVAMTYYEGRIPRKDYPPLIEAVKQQFGFEDSDDQVTRDTTFEEIPPLWHLSSHVGHDEDHERELIEGIVAAVNQPEHAVLVSETLKITKDKWETYWTASGKQIVRAYQQN